MKFSHLKLAIIALACFFYPVSAAEIPVVVVVYPEVSAPYRDSFEEILNGIAKRIPAHRVVVVGAPGSGVELLRQYSPTHIICSLQRQSEWLAASLGTSCSGGS